MPLAHGQLSMLFEDWRLLLMALTILDIEKISHKTYSNSFSTEHSSTQRENWYASLVLETPPSVWLGTGWALSLTPAINAVRDKRAPYLSAFHSLWRPGESALSYLSQVLVIIFVKRRPIASDGWGELWLPRTGWVRAEECGWVWNGVSGEVVFPSELWSCLGKGNERKGPKTHLSEVYITSRLELSKTPLRGQAYFFRVLSAEMQSSILHLSNMK